MKKNWRSLLAAFSIVFLSEMGDKTQITTLLLAGAKPLYVWYVALGSAMALITTSFLEVMLGSHLVAKYLKTEVIKVLSGVAFLVMGILLLTGVIGKLPYN
jgi:putative Ca2+/H+ antiporter (TMEM165/GDT1 family)